MLGGIYFGQIYPAGVPLFSYGVWSPVSHPGVGAFGATLSASTVTTTLSGAALGVLVASATTTTMSASQTTTVLPDTVEVI